MLAKKLMFFGFKPLTKMFSKKTFTIVIKKQMVFKSVKI